MMMAARLLPLLFVVLGPTAASAQRQVPVHVEPRHRVVHASDHLQVLDIRIQEGDTTLFHTHDAPMVYVTISPSTTDAQRLGGTWSGTVARTPPPGREGGVSAVLSYAEAPVTHRVTNVGPSLFHLIGILARAAPVDDAATAEPLPGADEGASAWFRTARLDLGPGQQAYAEAHAPVALVLVRDGRVAIHHADGWTTSLETAGAVRVVGPGSSYRVENGGQEPAEVILVEVR
jgi:hypothetical protein